MNAAGQEKGGLQEGAHIASGMIQEGEKEERFGQQLSDTEIKSRQESEVCESWGKRTQRWEREERAGGNASGKRNDLEASGGGEKKGTPAPYRGIKYPASGTLAQLFFWLLTTGFRRLQT